MIEYFENSSGLDSIWSGYTFILGFLIVFRSNQAYSRFWESAVRLHKGVPGVALRLVDGQIRALSGFMLPHLQTFNFPHVWGSLLTSSPN